ncbi:hypothetical protein LMG24235_08761 [Paraburkholderia sabiae]|nr:hypothetical protein LMG24235_08761 [Paraburkholderia sabiae]
MRQVQVKGLHRVELRDAKGRPMTATLELRYAPGSREHKIATAEGHIAQGIFGEHVADLDAAVVTEQRESIPAIHGVVNRFDQWSLRPKRRQFLPHRHLEKPEQRVALFLPAASPLIGWFAADSSLDFV